MDHTASRSPQLGMEVYTKDAAHIGAIKSIDPPVMHIDRHRKRDILVPIDYVSLVIEDEHRVDLSLSEQDMDDMDWEHP